MFCVQIYEKQFDFRVYFSWKNDDSAYKSRGGGKSLFVSVLCLLFCGMFVKNGAVRFVLGRKVGFGNDDFGVLNKQKKTAEAVLMLQ